MSNTGRSKIVVASDQHIGYQNSNAADFGNFLDDLLKRDDVKSFVILGDFVDMWRRDVSGVKLSTGLLAALKEPRKENEQKSSYETRIITDAVETLKLKEAFE